LKCTQNGAKLKSLVGNKTSIFYSFNLTLNNSKGLMKKNNENPKKVYFNARFLTMQTSGVQRYGIELVKALDRILDNKYHENKDISIILLAPKNIHIELSLKNIPIYCVGVLKGHFWEQLELPFYCRDGLLVSPCNTSPITVMNQILTIHDAAEVSIPMNFSFAFRTSYKILHAILGKQAQQIITVSHFSKTELVNHYNISSDKITVTYEGSNHIDYLEIDNSILHKNNLLKKKFILAVSTLNPNKNFASIIESFSYLGDFDCNLVIAGRKAKIFNQSENFISQKAKYVGFITDAELKALYKHADGFVFPSFYEGFGLPPLEAMACGCPVIVSQSAALPEICGDAALYCNPKDPKDIASKIRQLLSDPSLQNTLRQKGKERAQQFSWHTCAQETLTIIRKII
jgi:glycosyltransferase involved in cell wall biosynthesis